MSKISQWFRRRFRELDLLEDYFPVLFTRWQAALWGGSVLAVAFGWHFVTADWPYPVKVTACVAALFFAGYYVWRADHVRLIPRLELDRNIYLQETPTNIRDKRSVFIQILPRCMTESPVEECRGHLLRVFRRLMDSDEWEATEMNESLPLEWSLSGYEAITIYPGVDKRLNICFRENQFDIIRPTVSPLPARWAEVFDIAATFRFDIRISAKDCAPIDVSVAVRTTGHEWNKPSVQIIEDRKDGH